ncbi:MAG: DUF3368 domain-containing protein [Methanosarcinales archaeon]|nr:MAG: DUF3368 domain-containing protein [Methanosarcinales archaeon]
MMVVVCNSTPLIALSRIGKLELLREYFSEVYVPGEVYDEVVTRGEGLSGEKEVKSVDWIKVEMVTNEIAVDSLCTTLDRGESEVIVLAREKNALLILDDGDGRRIARSLGLKIAGTIGLLLLAAEDGTLDLKRSIEDLMPAGFRLSKKEYAKIVFGVMGG